MDEIPLAAQRVVDAALAEESARRRHVVVALSGAHAYGFSSPDSDFDIKAVHLEPTDRFLGLAAPRLEAARMEVIDGVEIDYTSNELGAVLAGVLKGNGNYIERILGHMTLVSSPEHEALRPIVQANLSQRVHRHYQGFATSQRKEFDQKPTAKKLLYVLRTTLTGAHLLRAGELRIDVNTHLDEYGFAAARELIQRKREGERVELAPDERGRWIQLCDRAFTTLDAALASSSLPAEPKHPEQLESWLVATRRRLT